MAAENLARFGRRIVCCRKEIDNPMSGLTSRELAGFREHREPNPYYLFYRTAARHPLDSNLAPLRLGPGQSVPVGGVARWGGAFANQRLPATMPRRTGDSDKHFSKTSRSYKLFCSKKTGAGKKV